MNKYVGLVLGFVMLISIKLYSQTNQINNSSVSADTFKANKSEESQGLSTLKKVTISGYLQPQFQIIESNGASSISGGNFEPNTNNRFIIRRGRLKTTFITKNTKCALGLNATEKGIKLDEIYIVLTLPFLKTVSFTSGIFDRPFGYEIGYSSSKVESAERSRVLKTLCPDEKDMGIMLTVNPTGPILLNSFTLDAGLFNGTGPFDRDFDNRKDFIAHLYFNQSAFSDIIKYRLGVSFLSGGFDNQRNNHYLWNNGFELVSNDSLARATRNFKGIEGELSAKWLLGTTQLRGEYVFGQQSNSLSSNKTPNTAPEAEAVTRDFTGGYLLFLHNFPKSKIQLVAKFDWMDPNSKISADNTGLLANTGKADLKYTTTGFGMNYNIDSNLKLLAYYELIMNESSTHLSGYTSDLKDDLFTLRLQYKF